MADFDRKEQNAGNNPEGMGHSKYSREKEQLLKTNFDDETNWNYLFMN